LDWGGLEPIGAQLEALGVVVVIPGIAARALHRESVFHCAALLGFLARLFRQRLHETRVTSVV
jgi:hypothetical protein